MRQDTKTKNKHVILLIVLSESSKQMTAEQTKKHQEKTDREKEGENKKSRKQGTKKARKTYSWRPHINKHISPPSLLQRRAGDLVTLYI